MRSARTAPYRCPDRRSFLSSPWSLSNGRKLAEGDLLKEWDQSLLLTAVRVVEIDMALAAGSGCLGAGTRLSLIPTWWSEGTGLRGGGEPAVFTVDPKARRMKFDLAMSIPGSEISRKVQLRSALALVSHPSGTPAPLAPKRPGSILWEDAVTVVIEGQAPRFPVSTVDFEQTGLGPPDACWRFEWSPRDLSLPAMACMRLYINKHHTRFHAAMTAPDPDETSMAMRSALKFQLAEEMLRQVLDQAEDLDAGDFPPDSAGKVLLDLLRNVFPGMDPGEIATLRQADPGEFLARLQAKLRLFRDSRRQEAGA